MKHEGDILFEGALDRGLKNLNFKVVVIDYLHDNAVCLICDEYT